MYTLQCRNLLTLLKRIINEQGLGIWIRWDRLGEKVDRVISNPAWWKRNVERINRQFPMLAVGKCTWGPVKVWGHKAMIALKKQICREIKRDIAGELRSMTSACLSSKIWFLMVPYLCWHQFLWSLIIPALLAFDSH